jgi:hypothetical protein
VQAPNHSEHSDEGSHAARLVRSSSNPRATQFQIESSANRVGRETRAPISTAWLIVCESERERVR